MTTHVPSAIPTAYSPAFDSYMWTDCYGSQRVVASRAPSGRLCVCGRAQPMVERRCGMRGSKDARARVHVHASEQ